MIIDTHCHIYASEMENAEEIIMEAADNDIHMVLNGTDPSSNREVLELSDKYDNVHAALGYFYTLADEITDEEIELLDRQLGSDNVVAVGEIGLDYYHTKDNRDKQIELFENMLILAEKHDLPVIVHSRKAMQDTFDILKKHDVVGSLHSYQGSAEMAQQFIRLGFYIGVGGTITHKNNKKARRMLENTDINHLLLETDSPYLSPQEKMGEMNTPLNIRYVVRKLAEELDMEKSEVIEITTENARNLFTI
ncbi:MAG: TatD family hydrolase [Methanobrevibacter sp.]|uniref:TatD family hydrolase n=1 Tax=Methanobrevibacter TaxID=2172 RepID=UPI00257BFE0D|nr:TatD family hydrolase [Methanobrevibacter sp.]MBR2664948.1 TatD family hydrolase [Methanobrevibacter sp.]MBR3197300.1 TatD family hydrolase [Methanobrevibacter sp.]MBR7049845.1 TatD family hydrolase [Methanobrevibacter sp.]